MCGICGEICCLGSAPPVIDHTNIIVKAQAHRGPDGSGVLNWGNVVLGHNRLSIIDLSSNATQPMQSECGRFANAAQRGEFRHPTRAHARLPPHRPERCAAYVCTCVQYCALQLSAWYRGRRTVWRLEFGLPTHTISFTTRTTTNKPYHTHTHQCNASTLTAHNTPCLQTPHPYSHNCPSKSDK